jgi:hypothetical protein
MSRLQDRAKPAFEKLFADDWKQLNADSALALASWATMFVMIIEYYDVSTMAVSQVEKDHLRRTTRPPDNWIICMGRYGGPKHNNGFWHRGALLIRPGVVGFRPNQQTTTFTLNGLAFHCLSTVPSALPDPQQYADALGLSLIWPSPANIKIPSHSFIDAGLIRVASYIWEQLGATMRVPPSFLTRELS